MKNNLSQIELNIQQTLSGRTETLKGGRLKGLIKDLVPVIAFSLLSVVIVILFMIF